jgi:Ice-binding-like
LSLGATTPVWWNGIVATARSPLCLRNINRDKPSAEIWTASGSAQASNIFWQVGSSATLGTNSVFKGTIMADQSITLNTGATLDGRALARIAGVTLQANVITKPAGGVVIGATLAGSMAQLASGGGWDTTITLANAGTSSAQVQLSFFDNDGNPLSLPLTFVQTSTTTAPSSTVNQTIAAGATLVILTQGENGVTQVGSAQLTTDGNVGGFAIFHSKYTDQECVVPFETRNASAYVLAFDNTNGAETGLALANVSNQAGNVPVILRDDTGVILSTATINLAGLGHTSFMLADNYAVVAGRRGSVEFRTPAGTQISAIGIRATKAGALTTIPVLVK